MGEDQARCQLKIVNAKGDGVRQYMMSPKCSFQAKGDAGCPNLTMTERYVED